MGFKELKEFDAEEVGMWLTAGGLGEDAPKFVEEGVDGDLLLSLSIDDFKADLGLSGLRAKKLMKNIEFTKNLATSGGDGVGAEDVEELKEKITALSGEKEELEGKVKELEDALQAKDGEIDELNNKMEAMKVEREEEEVAPAPEPAPAPAPEPAPAPAPSPKPAPSHHAPRSQPRQPGVIGGAARGAAGGALKGAIGEFFLNDIRVHTMSLYTCLIE